MSLGPQDVVKAPAVVSAEPDKYPFDLGGHGYSITTSHPGAQAWFNFGLNWMYGFCHEEAARCFQRAHELDPDCAMALWGLACSSGPHYNFGWEANSPQTQGMVAQRTHEYATRAKAVCEASKEHKSSAGISAVEEALIHAIQVRYPQASAAKSSEEYASWDAAYADRMEQVYNSISEDMDVVALYAESLLNLAPWKMWDVKTGEPLGAPARTLTAKDVLEKALKNPKGHRHPGILHMYIHLMEMSPQPEAAVDASNKLRGCVPSSGHLQHMASHIDVLVGTYNKAVTSNIAAIESDRKYLDLAGLAGIYTVYAMHNISSLAFAAMMAGNYEHTMAACDRLEQVTTEEFLRVEEPPWADYAEAATGSRYHALVRFGRWTEILDVPLPRDQQLYCVTTATAHYAKSVAHAALGDIAAAEQQRQLFISTASKVPDTRLHFPNKSTQVLGLARSMLEGELEYRKGNYEAAFAHLADAIHRDDELLYAEPPSWMVPARHAAAALLLEQGHAAEAAEYYAQDLGLDFTTDGPEKAVLARARQHPLNPWALAGYHDCLIRLGKTDAAQDVKKKLQEALSGADVKISTSCFCALKSVENGTGKDTERSTRTLSSL